MNYIYALIVVAGIVALYAFHRWFTLYERREQRNAELALTTARAHLANATRSIETTTTAAVADAAKTALPVVQSKYAGKCGSCKFFDVEMGQREMRRNPAFAGQMQHVPLWRSGRVLKLDAEGKELPLEEQGISKEMLALDWADLGACTCPTREAVIIAPIDTCKDYSAATAGA